VSDLTASAHAAVSSRWRLRLGVAVVLMALGALVATTVAVAYDESLLTPLLLWLGVVAVVVARRQVPRSVTTQERPRMAASAAWVVVGIVLYVVAPVVLGRL
jgi:hypothetical protein